MTVNAYTRLHAAWVFEAWHQNNAIDVTLKNVVLRNVLGVGSQTLQSMHIVQGFRNTWSLRFGGEYALPTELNRPLTLRAGLMFEPSAVPNPMLTPMTLNLNTLMASAGLEYRWHSFRAQATYAHLFMFERTVTQSAVLQLNAIGARDITTVGNGQYRSHADIVGLGFQVDL